jgi:DNA ligase-1
MARREFLQQAQTYKPDKHDISGYYISEKLDGQRCFWDGGVSRGLATDTVPWANIMDPKKPGEKKKKIKPIATGLWSRLGNPIIAPDWWLNELPQMFLDGELWAGRGKFQTLRSIVSRDVADDRWDQVQFAVYGQPSAKQLFQAGEIKNTNFVHVIDPAAVKRFFINRKQNGVMNEILSAGYAGLDDFDRELFDLQSSLPATGVVHAHFHQLLPDSRSQAESVVVEWMDRICDQGGEGLVFRKPGSLWTPKRVKECLKMKPFEDDCGTVIGFTSGSLTDKGSKARGMIGAVILNYNGMRLEMSGMNYSYERAFATKEQTAYAWQHPSEDMPSDFQGQTFKIGDTVEFRYRELSDAGLPKEARYHRDV